MTIQQCRYILKIAECGSFSEASKHLFVAQSSLSVSVKALEQELNIVIFERSGNGVYLTNSGAEFVRYARQITEQSNFILDRYSEKESCEHLHVSTQHYDFVADVFAGLLNQTTNSTFRFSLREMKTYDIIHETETAYCDVGIIGIKSSDYSIMERYIGKRGLNFTPVLKAMPHIFVRAGHPLAQQTATTTKHLSKYPYVSYEQGNHHISFFAEEIATPHSSRQVEISDRASLMNVLLQTDCYTIGTGIMPSTLNDGRIVSIPFEIDDFYIIGYLLRTDRKTSPMLRTFLEMLHAEVGNL